MGGSSLFAKVLLPPPRVVDDDDDDDDDDDEETLISHAKNAHHRGRSRGQKRLGGIDKTAAASMTTGKKWYHATAARREDDDTEEDVDDETPDDDETVDKTQREENKKFYSKEERHFVDVLLPGLHRFFSTFEHLNVPKSYVDEEDFKFGRVVHNFKAPESLTRAQRQALDDKPGASKGEKFVWDADDFADNQISTGLILFKKKFGHLNAMKQWMQTMFTRRFRRRSEVKEVKD